MAKIIKYRCKQKVVGRDIDLMELYKALYESCSERAAIIRFPKTRITKKIQK